VFSGEVRGRVHVSLLIMRLPLYGDVFRADVFSIDLQLNKESDAA
jgi:hypothetical protein